MSIIGYISAISGLFPLTAGLIKFRNSKLEVKILVIYFFFACLMDAVLIQKAFNDENNIWLLHYFTPLEYGLLVLVFSYWQDSPLLKSILRSSIGAFFIFFGGTGVLAERPQMFDSYAASLEGVMLIAISTYTLIMLNRGNTNRLTRDYRFWICSGVLIYFSGNLMLFSWSRIIVAWWMHNILNVLANFIFAGGILCSRLQQNFGGVY